MLLLLQATYSRSEITSWEGYNYRISQIQYWPALGEGDVVRVFVSAKNNTTKLVKLMEVPQA